MAWTPEIEPLCDSGGSGRQAVKPGKRKYAITDARSVEAAGSGAIFDGSKPIRPDVPPPIVLEAGLPNPSIAANGFMADAREAQSANRLAGWASDKLIGLLPEGKAQLIGRAAKGLIEELPAAVILNAANHERSHFEAAWNAGAGRDEVYWTLEPFPHSFFGATPTITARAYQRIGRGGQLEFSAGGTFGSQTAAREALKNMLEENYVHWSDIVWWGVAHNDISNYVFFNTGNDMTLYGKIYADATGRSQEDVHKQLLKGAVFNALDPMMVWALPKYFYNHIVAGEEYLKNPMPKAGDFQFMLNTAFHLARNGPHYELPVSVRHAPSGALMTVTPGLGDNGQWGLEGEVRRLPMGKNMDAGLSGAVWSQRDGPQPGPNRVGGAGGGAMSLRLGASLALRVQAGYKTSGDALGLPFKEGVYATMGAEIFPPAR